MKGQSSKSQKDETKTFPTHGWTGPETSRSALRWERREKIDASFMAGMVGGIGFVAFAYLQLWLKAKLIKDAEHASDLKGEGDVVKLVNFALFCLRVCDFNNVPSAFRWVCP